MENETVSMTFNASVTNTVVDAVDYYTNAATVGPGAKIFGWLINNPTAAAIFVQVFGVPAADVTLGTTVPIVSILLPNSGSSYVVLDNFIPAAKKASIVQANYGLSLAATATAGGSGAPGGTPDVRLLYYPI